ECGDGRTAPAEAEFGIDAELVGQRLARGTEDSAVDIVVRAFLAVAGPDHDHVAAAEHRDVCLELVFAGADADGEIARRERAVRAEHAAVDPLTAERPALPHEERAAVREQNDAG